MWDLHKAKRWLLQVGMDHIKDGLPHEGGELIYEAKWGDGCNTEDNFRCIMKKVCCWDEDIIDDAIKEIQDK
jgi:hypothetical protein